MKSSERTSTVSRAMDQMTERQRRRRRSYFRQKQDWSPANKNGVWIVLAAVIGLAVVLAVVTKLNALSKPHLAGESTWNFNLSNLRLP